MDEEQRLIGTRIALARREAGLTQRELATLLGITARSVQNYESGAVVPYKHLGRIESIANKRPGWILTADDREEDLVPMIGALHEAMEQQQLLLRDHLEVLRRQTELLRKQRQAAQRRQNGRPET
ncbi:MAG: helix-turn-helix domain-containing protein [Actinobacteria bacterium]|nr:MAG: helix-turn-helix domain-containing protein [Actinomycetota bacterium]TML49548.1 MAG: helix-turn-helix domain-containing protein [Actinomycetota bacterium]TML72425.1 MAG: helix-turn-helix domain-containing protein [Actinomycetota bacterium]